MLSYIHDANCAHYTNRSVDQGMCSLILITCTSSAHSFRSSGTLNFNVSGIDFIVT